MVRPTPSVLMFCSNFSASVGGAERQAEKLAAALVAKGCRVRILTLQVGRNESHAEVRNGFEIARLPLRDLSRELPGVPLTGLLNVANVFWSLGGRLRREAAAFDVLHVHLVGVVGAVAVRAAVAAGTPVLCKIGSSGSGADFLRITGNKYLDRWVNRTYRSGVDRWIATTDAVRDSMLDARIAHDRIIKIPNGVDVPPCRPAPRTAGARRFLYLGRLSRASDRDYATLLSAFLQLAAKHPQIELALVGAGDLLEPLRKTAGEHPARARVRLPGECEPDGWYAWADCFVLPSRREGLSNALLEAMAAGLVCVANDIPPNRETLADGQAGILVPVGDVDALATAMGRLIDDPEPLGQLGLAAWERARAYYSIGSVAERHIELYRRVREGLSWHARRKN